MTATEELRRMLDERGVEWDYGITGATTTRFSVNGIDLTFTPTRDGLVCSTILTPAQAIAATLGAEDTYTREDVESAFVSGYSLGCLPIDEDPTWDQNEQTFEEHMAEWGWVRKNATLGSSKCTNDERTNGTCVPVLDSERDGQPYLNPTFVCSECGFQLTNSRLGKVWQRYCPNCGRRVVE